MQLIFFKDMFGSFQNSICVLGLRTSILITSTIFSCPQLYRECLDNPNITFSDISKRLNDYTIGGVSVSSINPTHTASNEFYRLPKDILENLQVRTEGKWLLADLRKIIRNVNGRSVTDFELKKCFLPKNRRCIMCPSSCCAKPIDAHQFTILHFRQVDKKGNGYILRKEYLSGMGKNKKAEADRMLSYIKEEMSKKSEAYDIIYWRKNKNDETINFQEYAWMMTLASWFVP